MTGLQDQSTRLEYLDALGIDVWVTRAAPEDGPAGGGEPDAVAQAAPGEQRFSDDDWTALRAEITSCTRCDLHLSRTQTVFGVGNPAAEWMVIGEAPGAEEDRRGEPFVGRAGKLLDEILRSIGLDRNSVFIANILKCRPPNNRDPSADEAAQCRGHLDRQIAMVAPKIIVALGRVAAQQLLQSDTPVGRMRGRVYRVGSREIPTVVTYHPAYLLRSPSQKRKVWEDLCLALRTANDLPT